ncbi:hypothetical protein VFPPC_15184 [Pochonia chlamydosporia 170]|uniref:Uncharacterized protein n=1 Tax=Pochonia chlamydosporia 170 TaxID=1380566 RepID=A0A179G5F6_METCM|nr:hypothetical protein VFPPC_15184 [Pochonia chlamydosporia 170]OAQ72718.1 hypothetical protein VFPPC_15184 [Pochonia chlamydosporia 170]
MKRNLYQIEAGTIFVLPLGIYSRDDSDLRITEALDKLFAVPFKVPALHPDPLGVETATEEWIHSASQDVKKLSKAAVNVKLVKRYH